MDLPLFGRGKFVQYVVRDIPVVVPKQGLGVFSDLSQSSEDANIEHAAAVTPVERFDEAVMHRLARLDEAELDAVGLSPFR